MAYCEFRELLKSSLATPGQLEWIAPVRRKPKYLQGMSTAILISLPSSCLQTEQGLHFFATPL